MTELATGAASPPYKLVWSGDRRTREPAAGHELRYWVVLDDAAAVKAYVDEWSIADDAILIIEIEDGSDHFAKRRSVTTAEEVRRWDAARRALPDGRPDLREVRSPSESRFRLLRAIRTAFDEAVGDGLVRPVEANGMMLGIDDFLERSGKDVGSKLDLLLKFIPGD